MFKKKNIFASIAMLLVAMPVLVFSFLHIKQIYTQHLMEERLEKNALQTITLQKNDFTWVKANKEIKINGCLFDVKSFTKTEEAITFIGLYDSDEDAIKNAITLLHHKDENKKTSNKFSILKLAFTPFLKTDFSYSIDFFINTNKINYVVYNASLVKQWLLVNTPPPLI